jgi:hypothetical protein
VCVRALSLFPTAAGALEGSSNWSNSVGCSGDCHFLVHNSENNLLYEGWACDVEVNGSGAPTQLSCTCLVRWNTDHLYPSDGRGEGCTSADAAGFPISTLLFTPEEIQAGSIDHAIRFILPNSRMRAKHYSHPASH